MGNVKLIVLFFLLQIAASNVVAQNECHFLISKVLVPFENVDDPKSLCLDEYFQMRDLGRYSYKENEKGKLIRFKDRENLEFEDMILFDVSEKKLNSNGQIESIKAIFNSFQGNINSEYGQCRFQIKGNNKDLSINDFVLSYREEGGQPGTRLMLTKGDVINPQWEMTCTSSLGSKKIVKKGTYFFVFIDVYENIGTQSNLKHHLAKFFFKFRQ